MSQDELFTEEAKKGLKETLIPLESLVSDLRDNCNSPELDRLHSAISDYLSSEGRD